ncbi:hypothetical protein K0B96_01585 [Horticoccus luteus]|uniref:Tetratricopeptide repeat protein n=1 Tax=Horticoccus luteus TaxID=2862869 RepID=A0A8F9TXH2_9BACT|nr:hypothetical protein [Horticoccus luteus]QYM79337.1 hypothetical protein K0B96_01585 [Horticoccus luteus]
MQVTFVRRRSHHRRRRRIIAAAIGVVVIAAVILLREPVTRVLARWRAHRALTQAQGFIAQKDLGNAFLALQVAAQANPGDRAALRMAADVLESAGSNQAVRVRQQVANGHSAPLKDRLALVATALRFNDLIVAESGLANFSPAERGMPDFLKLATAVNFSLKRSDVAEGYLDQLLALEPDNEQMKFNRAVLRMRHANRSIADEAKEQLTRIAAKAGPYQAGALRELARDAAARRQPEEALEWGSRLVALPTATFDDQLFRINLLRLAAKDNATLVAAEQALGARAARSAEEAAQFANWLNVQGRADEARRWLRGLPSAIRQDARVKSAEADVLVVLKDWTALGELLQQGAWGEVSPEIIRLALSARTLADRQRNELRQGVWQEALTLAKADPVALRVLLRLTIYWHWAQEEEDTLYVFARGFPNESWTLASLVSSAYARKDTEALKKAYSLWHVNQPNNQKVTGDWAMLMLLTEPGTAETKASDAAKELAAAEPNNPFFVTAQAYALYQRNQLKAALDLMERLSPSDLNVPGRALYFGLMLAADGQLARADGYLKLAAKADLLPEERDLLVTAQALVSGAPKPMKPAATRKS